MGTLAKALAEYAQPLIDQTDGSPEQLERALMFAQICFNLALLPEDEREKSIEESQATLKLNDADFAAFKRVVIRPMIDRHREMFPMIHGGLTLNREKASPPSPGVPPTMTSRRTEAYPGTGRYDPCPCNSGRKYKFCCGSTRR